MTDTAPDTRTAAPDNGKPETIRLMLLLFAVAVGGEILHQILSVTIGLMDPSALLSAAKDALSEDQAAELSEGAVTTSVYTSIVLAGALGVAIMGLLAFMLVLINRRSRHAGLARRMLLVFGFYFGFRTLLLFVAAPGGNDVPVAMYLLDGGVQIIVGVAAVLGLIFSFRPETLKWTREIDDSGHRTDPRRK
ncbi:MAG: hypothetical protein GX570_01550 [Corynebacterium marinum]|jgi:ABC-type antimicrobial peptide transport system permease subunit|uniref:Uncharacterized protein n=1 Tax=Corynebacterium marinum TaxID=349751 RepID=A0A847H8H2_9CORY|nr:hypothetical protein [Corynebacterium marinum]